MSAKAATPSSRLTSQDPVDVKWRGDQMRASSAIEGIEGSPSLRAYAERLESEGVPLEERIRLIGAYEGDSNQFPG